MVIKMLFVDVDENLLVKGREEARRKVQEFLIAWSSAPCPRDTYLEMKRDKILGVLEYESIMYHSKEEDIQGNLESLNSLRTYAFPRNK